MDPAKASKAELLFNQAINLAPAERTAFLAEACEDDAELREHLKELLAAEAEAGDFLPENPSAVATMKVRALPRALGAFGDYELLEEIARGGMGVVFKARQVNLSRFVALKLINSGVLASDATIERFKAEAKAAAFLNHSNIVPIHEIGEVHGQHYFSMGLIEGENLRAYLHHHKLSQRESAELIITIARAVHHAHQRGILHRDIKPSNILIDKTGTPHLTDFGLAKIGQHDSTLTHTNAILGTPSYMAPEQARGETKQVTTAADVYGLGAVLYECLTAQPPFAGGTSIETIRQVLDQDARPPSQWNRTVDRDLDTICLKSLEKDPARRYASAEAFADDLRRWHSREPIQARPVSGWERLTKWAQRRPAAAALTVVSVLAAIALTAVGISVPAYQTAESSRRMELQQRHTAEKALQQAEEARIMEHDARRKEAEERQIAQIALAEVERLGYLKNFGFAALEWASGDVFAADRLLDETRPNLRAWEWHYLKRLCMEPDRTTNTSRIVAKAPTMFSLAFNGDGSQLISHGSDGQILCDPVTGQKSLTLGQKSQRPGRIAFHPNDDRFAYANTWAEATLATFNPPGQTVLLDRNVFDLAFSPDGEILATASQDNRPRGNLSLWNARSAKLLRIFAQSTNGFSAVRFSPDGKLLAAAESYWGGNIHFNNYKPGSHSVRVWELSSGRLLHKLEGHHFCIWQLAFSPDGKLLASCSGLYGGGAVGEIKIWDLQNGQERFDLKGHRSCVFTVAFSPDGSRLASGGHPYIKGEPVDVRIWDVLTGQQVFSLKGHTARVTHVAFSPSGNYLASASEDGSIRLWDGTPVPPETQIDLVRHQNARLSDAWQFPRNTPKIGAKQSLFELPQGHQRLGGVRFDIRAITQLKGQELGLDFPERVAGVQVNQRCRRMHFLHGTGGVAPNGTEIGRYLLHFSDGRMATIPIVYGQDVREWSGTVDQDNTSRSAIAWSGTDRNQVKRIFRSTWTNSLPEVEIETLDFVSTMTDCFPFLLAITVD